jgi:hypothetical protein
MLIFHELFDRLHEIDLAGTRRCKRKAEIGGNFPAPGGTLLGLTHFNNQLVKTKVEPCLVQGEIKDKIKVSGVTVAGGNQMKGKGGKYMMFAPVEVTVRQQLQAVGMVHGHACQTLRQFPDVERTLDLLDPWRIVTKYSVHPAVNPE